MKKTIFILFSTALFISCNQSSSPKDSGEENNHDHPETTELTLNNGAKWQADSNTNRHLINIKTTANMFRVSPSPSVDRYQMLGSDIQEGINSMIRDCTMEGAPDEALHKWFLPILQHARELKSISDTARARSIFDSLDHRIDIYHDYFE